jgi:eukaryotic-like serine/threonine-protein kinase
MPLSQSQELNGRYRIVNLIGQGGFGAVYRAWDLNLKRPCAVKENLDISAEAQKQFDREVQLLANLHHSNLPRIYDCFFLPGMGQYLVMDFIEGQDLQSMLEARGPLPEAEVIPWIRQICEALDYMHSQSPPVIHRDIKPANIIITPQGRAMLVDFGISKVYDPQLKTTVGARAVTPGFSPWEQYGQGSTDNRSDIYALGATLYALLTGQEPPESIALMGGVAALVSPRELNPTIAPHVAQAIEQALQSRPTDRFAGAAALSQALQPPPAALPSTAPAVLPLTAARLTAPVSPAPPIIVTPPDPVASLTAQLRAGATASRAAAALALGRLGQANAAVTTALQDVYHNDDADAPRHAALQALLALGQAQAVGMVHAPAGEFLMGSANGDSDAQDNEKPQHCIELPAYFIDRTPVTNAQYARFIATGGYANPAYWQEAQAAGRWKDGKFIDYWNNNRATDQPRYWNDKRWNQPDYPVVGVSWWEALAYARWAGKRLPTEAEWEKAARGPDGRIYPWGNNWDPARANTVEANRRRTTPVEQFAQNGASPYGALDMAGNVWEWCSTRWSIKYPYTPDDGREDLGGGEHEGRVLRGGSWAWTKASARCAARAGGDPGYGRTIWGLRCCATSSLSSPTGSEF